MSGLGDLRPRRDGAPAHRHLVEAVGWLCRAQDAVEGGGVSYGFDVRRGWLSPYPETTGYIITTFLRGASTGAAHAAGLDADDLRERAARMARWLTKVQLLSGALPGGTTAVTPFPTVFNTGQVLEGWCEAYREQPDPTLRHSLTRAAGWLVDVQDGDGCWRKWLSPLTVQTPATYNVRTAAALLKAGRLLDEPAWTAAALKNFDWALTQQDGRGWFENNCLTDETRALTHTIGYTLEGLLDAAELSGREEYLDAVRRASERLQGAVRADGFLAGRLDADWRPLVSWCCLTGSCQLALVWSRLAKLLGEPGYAAVAGRLLGFVKATQNVGPADQAAQAGDRRVTDGTRGGIKGSHPIWGDYDPFVYPNWAAKFFVDALLAAPPATKPAVFTYATVLSSTGGGQHAMTLLARELYARGYEPTFFTRPPLRRDHRYVRWLAELGIPVHVLPRWDDSRWARWARRLAAPLLTLPYALWRRCGLAAARQAADSIVRTLAARREQKRILGRFTRCLREATGRGKRVILHVWGPAALTPLLLEWASREGVPAVYHEMGEADEKYVETWDLGPTVAAVHRAAAVVCCSGSVAANVRRVYGYQGRVETVPFMIADPGPAGQRGRKANGRLTFGAIGRLVPHKRHADLLAAIRALAEAGYDVGLVIAGSGPLLGPLQEEAARLGIRDRVTFTGEFERLEDVMAQFDVFVLTSSSESQCMPVTESMAYGKPVVASAFGGMPDFVEHGVTGLLVPVGDVPALVAALRSLADNPALRERMGEAGRRRYLERCTPGRITDAVERTYERLLADRPAAGLRLGYVMECYATFIVDEVRWLRQLGARVTLFNAFRPLPEDDPAKEAFRRESLYFPTWYRGVIAANVHGFLCRPLAYLRSLALLRREGDSLRMLFLAGYYARKVRRDGIQHLHGTFGTRTTTLAHVTALLSGRDFSFTTHAYDIYRPNPSLVWKTNRAAFMRTISEFNKRSIEEVYRGIEPSRVRVVYLGVDTKRFIPQQPCGGTPTPVRLIAVGSLIEQKGHVVLIRACKLLRDQGYRFLCGIIGDGEKRRVVEEELTRLGMAGHVELLGNLPHDEVLRRLQESQIFALPCIDLRGQGEHIDGIPVALMEAMAEGLPTVSTAISGIPELIEDGDSGLLVPERDEVRLAEALKRLIDDGDLRARLGRGGRKRIEERFELGTNVGKLVRLYWEALQTN